MAMYLENLKQEIEWININWCCKNDDCVLKLQKDVSAAKRLLRSSDISSASKQNPATKKSEIWSSCRQKTIINELKNIKELKVHQADQIWYRNLFFKIPKLKKVACLTLLVSLDFTHLSGITSDWTKQACFATTGFPNQAWHFLLVLRCSMIQQSEVILAKISIVGLIQTVL